MAARLDRKSRLLRVGGYPRKGMIGDITELAAWEMAIGAGTRCRNWDAGTFCVVDMHGNGTFWYSRRRDDSWTEKQVPHSGVPLNRKKRLWSVAVYPTVDHMLGEHSELKMWGMAVHQGVTCAEWDAGAFTLLEDGFKNRYEREPDGTWVNARTVALVSSW